MRGLDNVITNPLRRSYEAGARKCSFSSMHLDNKHKQALFEQA
jgi:hypothetical protein